MLLLFMQHQTVTQFPVSRELSQRFIYSGSLSISDGLPRKS